MLFSILVWLPADYIHDNARLVCRRWYDIIHSQSFINAHFQQSTYCLLLSNYSYKGRTVWMMTATSQGLIQTNEFSYKFRERFLGTCNGLMLVLVSSSYTILNLQIINLATKQALLLPPFTAPAPVGTDLHPTYLWNCLIAYAAASMKYKVALSYRISSSSSSLPSAGLAILSVGVDNSWRQVRVDHLSELARTLLTCAPLMTEGFIHWVDESKGKTVLTLDVETEILTMSEVPFQKNECTELKFYLSTGRSLSLLSGRGYSREDRRLFDLWEMNPETKEWMKLVDDIKLGDQQLRLQQLGFRSGVFLRPHGWLKYPEVLLFSGYIFETPIISYNLDTHEINSTKFPVTKYDTHAMYKNSLLWLS